MRKRRPSGRRFHFSPDAVHPHLSSVMVGPDPTIHHNGGRGTDPRLKAEDDAGEEAKADDNSSRYLYCRSGSDWPEMIRA